MPSNDISCRLQALVRRAAVAATATLQVPAAATAESYHEGHKEEAAPRKLVVQPQQPALGHYHYLRLLRALAPSWPMSLPPTKFLKPLRAKTAPGTRHTRQAVPSQHRRCKRRYIAELHGLHALHGEICCGFSAPSAPPRETIAAAAYKRCVSLTEPQGSRSRPHTARHCSRKRHFLSFAADCDCPRNTRNTRKGCGRQRKRHFLSFVGRTLR